jgi:hypothetical protein
VVINVATGVVIYLSMQALGVYTGLLVLSSTLNSCGLGVLTLLTQAGGLFHLAGVLLLVVVLPAIAPSHQNASWVFTHFERAQAESVGIISPV